LRKIAKSWESIRKKFAKTCESMRKCANSSESVLKAIPSTAAAVKKSLVMKWKSLYVFTKYKKIIGYEMKSFTEKNGKNLC